MSTCSKCGKKGFFLKLVNGLCSDCCSEIDRQTTRDLSFISASEGDIDFAEAIMNSLMLSASVSENGNLSVRNRYSKKVQDVHSRFSRQGEIAAYASNVCGEPATVKGYYVKSWACEWAGAKFRQETIKWTQKWIESGLLYPGCSDGRYTGCTVLQSRQYDAYLRIGKACEGEYMFEEALSAYEKGHSARPDAYSLIVAMSRVLTKMNRLDDAIRLIDKSPCPNPLDKNIRRETLKELKDKKERGYVYRARKKKSE